MSFLKVVDESVDLSMDCLILICQDNLHVLNAVTTHHDAGQMQLYHNLVTASLSDIWGVHAYSARKENLEFSPHCGTMMNADAK